jgi:HlyD family secretion protein
MKKIFNLIAMLSIVSILLVACSGAPIATPAPESPVSSNEVIAEGRLEPIQGTNLTFQVRGVVEQVFVQAGDTVKQGDVLARLTNAGAAEAQVLIAQNDYAVLLRNEGGDRAKLWQAYLDAQTARATAEKKWEDLNVEDIEDRIERDKGIIEERQANLEDAQEEFDKYKDLDEDNSKRKTAEDDLEHRQEDLNRANRDLEEDMRERDEVRAAYDAALGVEAEAKYQYEISVDGPNSEKLAFAKTNLDAALDTLSNYVLTAPFDGVVVDVNVKPGEQVGIDTRVVSVADFGSWTVKTTDVTELEVVKLSVGQKVLLVPDALPDLELNGTVLEISDAYTQQGGDILYTVRIQVDDPDERLRWGMTVEATFLEVTQQ